MSFGRPWPRIDIDNQPKSPYTKPYAGVVKLVDARDSKSRGGDPMRVRFSPPAPNKNKGLGLQPNPFCVYASPCGYHFLQKQCFQIDQQTSDVRLPEGVPAHLESMAGYPKSKTLAEQAAWDFVGALRVMKCLYWSSFIQGWYRFTSGCGFPVSK